MPVTEADPRQINVWLTSGEAVLVDVREPAEHARERIRGAKLVPLSRFDPQQAGEGASARQKIVMQCRGGRRSLDAANRAAAAMPGREIVSMAGGLEAWKRQGLPVECDTRAPALSVMRQTQLAIGLGILTGAALTWWVDPLFILMPVVFGMGLCVAGLTGTCGLAVMIEKMPWNRAACAPCVRPAAN